MRKEAGNEDGPFQSILPRRQGTRVHRCGPRRGSVGRRRRLHQAVPGLAGTAHGVSQGPAHPLMHRRPGDGRDPGRYSAGGRGHHTILHLRIHRQRLRTAGRSTGIRGHPARHPQPGREMHRGRRHCAYARHRAGALRRRRLRDGRDHRPRGALRAAGDRRRGTGNHGRLPGATLGCDRSLGRP